FDTAVTFSPDGKRLVVSSTSGLQVWDATTWLELFTLPSQATPRAAFSPDGTRLATRSGEEVTIWDAAPRSHCLYSNAGHPRHRQYLRNQAWERAATLAARKEYAGAEAGYRQLLGLQKKLVADDPRDAGKQHELGIMYFELGAVLEQKGSAPEAVQAYRRAVDLLQP